MQLFAPLEGLELQILKRGGPVVKVGGEVKGGGGEVVFKCPVVRKVKTLNFVEPGRVRKIRGLA
jgi:RNA 3'-terminal phosphate cyclase-like protein